jgi:hypothetical protein
VFVSVVYRLLLLLLLLLVFLFSRHWFPPYVIERQCCRPRTLFFPRFFLFLFKNVELFLFSLSLLYSMGARCYIQCAIGSAIFTVWPANSQVVVTSFVPIFSLYLDCYFSSRLRKYHEPFQTLSCVIA